MKERINTLAMMLIALSLGTVLILGCSQEDQNKAREKAATAQTQVKQSADDVKQQLNDAWASIRTDGERLVDQVQTRNDPSAKKNLLDDCRNALERIRKADSGRADQVDKLCNDIRDTDVNAKDKWNDIKARMQQLTKEFTG